MKAYLENRLVKIGLLLVVVGWGPLFAIILLAAIGLWPDPNPNPIGPGLLFALTSWPAIICLGIGIFQVHRGRSTRAGESMVVDYSPSRDWSEHPAVRVVAGCAGVGLIIYGTLGVLDGEGRGAAAAIVIGIAAGYFALAGRLPAWFRQ